MIRPTRLFDWAAGFVAVTVILLAAFSFTFPLLPLLKAVPAAVWAISFVFAPGRFKASSAVALGLASAGDFLLGQGGFFLVGVGCFAVYQLLFGIRFWKGALERPRPRKGLVPALLLYGLISAALLGLCLPRVGTMAVPMATYALLLTAMASGAAAGLGWRVAWGGALFYASDALIMGFQAWPSFSSDAAILAPYFLGQYLIVKGVRDS